jgi:lipopolysaccharide transport system permease protein
VRGSPGVLGESLSLLYRHRVLTWELAKREVRDRHVGSVLGLLWVVLHPLVQLGVYAVVFTQIFKVKFGRTPELPFGYTTYIFAGLLPWLAVSESVSRSSVALRANASLVKQVVFPIEVLPIKSTLAVFVGHGVALALAAVFTLASEGRLPWTYVMLPLLLVMELVLLSGIGWAIAAVGAYFRDLKEFVQVFLFLGVYSVPAFYPEAWVPPALRWPILLNPFSHLVYVFQDVMYYGRFQHPWSWLVTATFAAAAFYLGFRLFRKLKAYYGTIL